MRSVEEGVDAYEGDAPEYLLDCFGERFTWVVCFGRTEPDEPASD